MSTLPTCSDTCKHERYTPAYVTDPRGWPSYWSVVDGEGKAEILPDGPDGRRSRGLHVFEADMRAAYLTGEAHGYERGKAEQRDSCAAQHETMARKSEEATREIERQRDALLAERDGAREAIASAQKLWSVDRAALEEARRALARVERACEEHREKASGRAARAEAMAEGMRAKLDAALPFMRHKDGCAVRMVGTQTERCGCGMLQARAALSQPADGVGGTTKAGEGGGR